jgi:hypothetical protein
VAQADGDDRAACVGMGERAGLVLLDPTIMGREPRRRSLEASTAEVRAVPVSSRPTDRRASRDDLITLQIA